MFLPKFVLALYLKMIYMNFDLDYLQSIYRLNTVLKILQWDLSKQNPE